MQTYFNDFIFQHCTLVYSCLRENGYKGNLIWGYFMNVTSILYDIVTLINVKSL
jgi:hypothetical protein